MFKGSERFYLRFTAILALLIGFQSAYAETYILSRPIEQATRLKLSWVAASSAYNLGVLDIPKVVVAYHTTGSVKAAAAVGALSLLYEAGFGAPVAPRGHLKLFAEWKRRKNIQQIANIPGVNQIRLISAGKLENHSYLTATLHTKSIAFIETDGPLSPDRPDFKDWQKVDDLDSSKLVLRLKKNGEETATPIEIPFKELFESKEIDPEHRAQWIAEVTKWDKSRPLKERLLSSSASGDQIAIETSIVMNGEETKIGDLASGKTIHKVLKNTLTDKVLNWAKKLGNTGASKSPAKIGSKNITVVEKEDFEPSCKNIINTALGNLFLRK